MRFVGSCVHGCQQFVSDVIRAVLTSVPCCFHLYSAARRCVQFPVELGSTNELLLSSLFSSCDLYDADVQH